MTDDLLPALIPIPAVTAATLELAGDLTARDVSFAVAVMAVAGARGETGGRVVVHDARLREAVGQSRRGSIAVEEARWERMRRAEVSTADALAVTGLPLGCPYPGWLDSTTGRLIRTRSRDGEVPWTVAPALAESFVVRPGDAVVMLPRRLLQVATSRYAVVLALRVMAWALMFGDRRWEVSRTGDALELMLTDLEFRNTLGIGAAVRSSEIERSVIGPAGDEINANTAWYVEIEPARTRYARTAKTGKLRGWTVRVAIPAETPNQMELFRERAASRRGVDAPAAAVRRRPSRGARKRPEPAPAETGNVRSIQFSADPANDGHRAIDNAG